MPGLRFWSTTTNLRIPHPEVHSEEPCVHGCRGRLGHLDTNSQPSSCGHLYQAGLASLPGFRELLESVHRIRTQRCGYFRGSLGEQEASKRFTTFSAHLELLREPDPLNQNSWAWEQSCKKLLRCSNVQSPRWSWEGFSDFNVCGDHLGSLAC